MPARSEPLLWVQLIGAGALPLEALLLLLLLAGSDPGPVPGLERLLCWALGGLAPTLMLWHRPADVWSLLLLQTPLRARRPLQQRLSRLQDALGLRLGLALAAVCSLPLLWWLDEHAAVASSLSPLQESPRLVVLLLAALVLALMLWQWQQLLQALWLLSRRDDVVAAAKPMPQAELQEQRLCLGLPLLLLDPLSLAASTTAATTAPGRHATAASQPADPPPSAAAGPASAASEAPAAEPVPAEGIRPAQPQPPVRPPAAATASVSGEDAPSPSSGTTVQREVPIADAVPAERDDARVADNPVDAAGVMLVSEGATTTVDDPGLSAGQPQAVGSEAEQESAAPEPAEQEPVEREPADPSGAEVTPAADGAEEPSARHDG